MTPRTALVAGASRGLGAAVVRELSSHGWDTIGTSRSVPTSALRALGTWIEHDAASDDTAALRSEISSRSLDALIVSTMLGGPKGGIATVEPQSLLQSFDVSVGGALRIIRACLPALQRSGAPTIAIISSRLGSISAQARGDFRDFDTSYAYRISKAAQNMLVTNLAREFGSSMRCWAVHPGALSTTRGRPGADKSPDEAARQLRAELDSENRDSPRFLSLGATDLEW